MYLFLIEPLRPARVIKADHDMSSSNVLIWVDTMGQGPPGLQRYLTMDIRRELLKHEAAAEITAYGKIANFRSSHPDYARLSIQDLGQQFQVDEVLYILIDVFEFGYEAGEGYYRPQMSGYIKVIASGEGGRRLWPVHRTHEPAVFEGKLSQGEGADYANRVLEKFCREMASGIGLHFYDHKAKR